MTGDINKEQDFLEFFGKSATEVLSPLVRAGNVNALHRTLFPIHDIPLKELHNIILTSDYFTAMSQAVTDNWFNSINNTGAINEDAQAFPHMICQIPLQAFKDRQRMHVKVLDYGCGNGSHGLWCALQGYDVTLADIPHKHFQFLKFLCDKYGVKINFYDVPCSNVIEFPDKYDYIINSEVMEHCDEPILVLKSLIGAMKDDGIMYLSTFFDDCNGEDPTHLRKNTIRYNDCSVWAEIVEKAGLTCSMKNHCGTPKGFIKT